MGKPTIHGNRRALSASSVLEAIATDLLAIKTADRLTFADLGRIFGKSEDQAAKYCEGSAEMSVTAFAFARKEWNGRFTGSLDALIDESRGDASTDREKESRILNAALQLSIALTDGTIKDDEIRANRATLENAKDAIEALLKRVTPRAVQA